MPIPEDGRDSYWDEQFKLKKQWWQVSLALLLHEVPNGYYAYRVLYGKLEDDFDDPAGAWREAIHSYFDYSPEILAAFPDACAA